MRMFASLIFCATLPFVAGFAVSAHAQDGMQYDGPGGVSGNVVPSMPVTGMPQSTTAMPVGSGAPIMAAPIGATPGDMTRMGALEQQVRELTNQLEQRDFQLRTLQQNFDKYVSDSSQRLQALENRAPVSAPDQPYRNEQSPSNLPSDQPPPPNPVPNNQGGQVNGSLTDPNGAYQPNNTPQLGQITENVGGPNDGSITSGRPQGSAQPSAAKAYDQAFSYLQQSNYSDAQTAFNDFLKTYPTHPLAANAKYWLGEAYYAQTQYSQAAKTFAKAFQEHPQGQKAPDALLKLAMTLDKMNKRNDACLTLTELTKRFPSGPASVLRRGQEEATRMQCAS